MAVVVLRPRVNSGDRFAYPHVSGPAYAHAAVRQLQPVPHYQQPYQPVQVQQALRANAARVVSPSLPQQVAPAQQRDLRQCQTQVVSASVQEMTNSFLYCPLLLAAADLLDPASSSLWKASTPWWPSAIAALKKTSELSLQEFVDAYDALVFVARDSNEPIHPEDDAGLSKLKSHLTKMSDANVKVSLRWLVSTLVERQHLPPLAQDLLLQMWGGLQFAGDMQAAADASKQGRQWQDISRVQAWSKA
eukprot:TRINITY_DN20386_c0_g2_i1.p1 TRINITY_DN20386_c0_g2~~TRINITY_DN20386_c0_g2_i1.p1  ORF type:complete len:266 (+),score=31.55 TRINITY_DN20386_c0_g2_i1:60-800(+)